MTSNSPEKQSKVWYNLILHLHPRKVKPDTLRFTLTFGLGGMAALLVVIQVFTGLLLKFHYIPSPDGAYNSILNINENLFLVNWLIISTTGVLYCYFGLHSFICYACFLRGHIANQGMQPGSLEWQC
jgi:quinol-cytochrome oxidoreductase complex cytochrome b subunit